MVEEGRQPRQPVVEKGRQARLETTDWRPKLIALDIDGTLLRWIEGAGASQEEVTPAVHAAVQHALDEGAEIVLASGRAPHNMTVVADMLGLHDPDQPDRAERVWVVAANGAVVFRYPPMEIVHEVLFDAGPAVHALLDAHPTALVAVEERGLGYRVTAPFPEGELGGTTTIVDDVDDLVSAPVSRVIVRDPDATVEEFEELARSLGLQGTDYAIGWTAWLDLAPVGISKASGLQYVAEQLGIDAADVLAIGDGRNDLEMFEWAGRAVAMGQAIEEVRQAADHITLTVDEDGAAVEIDSWFVRSDRPGETEGVVRSGEMGS
ncbi:MAG: HAD-IIB family hydrolase [Nocardioidaceae bacterium]|nr:HAD-IIB family hydrolase [Nocardioidaceae bacterium]MCL2614294.1 HAD-IIB family hydrolase [Nocardioidaceae bacterium]